VKSTAGHPRRAAAGEREMSRNIACTRCSAPGFEPARPSGRMLSTECYSNLFSDVGLRVFQPAIVCGMQRVRPPALSRSRATRGPDFPLPRCLRLTFAKTGQACWVVGARLTHRTILEQEPEIRGIVLARNRGVMTKTISSQLPAGVHRGSRAVLSVVRLTTACWAAGRSTVLGAQRFGLPLPGADEQNPIEVLRQRSTRCMRRKVGRASSISGGEFSLGHLEHARSGRHCHVPLPVRCESNN